MDLDPVSLLNEPIKFPFEPESLLEEPVNLGMDLFRLDKEFR